MILQSLLRLAFPPQCVSCDALVEENFGLCGACWPQTPFVKGLVCDSCGTPLHGDIGSGPVQCDDCLVIARPWRHGRAALLYKDNARRLVLALKHGDRLDLVRPASDWMVAAAKDLAGPRTVLVPVPAHPLRLLRRRYNQAALLANAMAKKLGRAAIPDLLRRTKHTRAQDGMSRDDRFANVQGAIQPARAAQHRLRGRNVLLVDDVMTSGATLAAATEACHQIGAAHVDVIVLARVAKDD